VVLPSRSTIAGFLSSSIDLQHSASTAPTPWRPARPLEGQGRPRPPPHVVWTSAAPPLPVFSLKLPLEGSLRTGGHTKCPPGIQLRHFRVRFVTALRRIKAPLDVGLNNDDPHLLPRGRTGRTPAREGARRWETTHGGSPRLREVSLTGMRRMGMAFGALSEEVDAQLMPSRDCGETSGSARTVSRRVTVSVGGV